MTYPSPQFFPTTEFLHYYRIFNYGSRFYRNISEYYRIFNSTVYSAPVGYKAIFHTGIVFIQHRHRIHDARHNRTVAFKNLTADIAVKHLHADIVIVLDSIYNT